MTTSAIDVDGTYGADEQRAQLIERTAKAIFRGKHDPDVSADEAYVWESLWQDAAPDKRIRCRNQARAALAASDLLKQVEDLEQRIAAARRELVVYGGELDGPSLARKVNRVDRILSKPVPDPEPIGVKHKP